MNTEIEKIILESDYSELTSRQLDSIQEWASSEEEFSTLQQILRSALSLHEEVGPSPELKSSLMETFQNKNATAPEFGGASANGRQDKRNVLFLRMKYMASAAALFLILFMLYPLMKTSVDENNLAKNEVVKSDKKKDEGAQKEIPNQNMKIDKEERNTTPRVLESPLQLAVIQNAQVNSASRNISNDAQDAFTATRLTPVDSEVLTMSSSFTMSPTVSFNKMASSGNITAFHSDRIVVADLPQKSRQVIHERPELLDLLHTSY